MDSPLSLVRVKGRADSSANILDVAKKSLLGELSSAIVRPCSCYLSSWRYLTLTSLEATMELDLLWQASAMF